MEGIQAQQASPGIAITVVRKIYIFYVVCFLVDANYKIGHCMNKVKIKRVISVLLLSGLSAAQISLLLFPF
jgi:fumarate reductase subunit D